MVVIFTLLANTNNLFPGQALQTFLCKSVCVVVVKLCLMKIHMVCELNENLLD